MTQFSLSRRLILAVALSIVCAVVLYHFGQITTAKLVLPLGALGAVWAAGEPYIAYLISVGLVNSGTYLLDTVKKVVAKTANYTVLGTEGSGTIFTNRAAGGAVTFTLPAPAANLSGVWYEFMGVADQTFTVSAGAGLGVALNNAACASLACSTGGQKIGAVIRAYCDGTSWILQGSTIGVAYTVA
jgi:hypothetical protein